VDKSNQSEYQAKLQAKHATGGKRGKTRLSQSRLVTCEYAAIRPERKKTKISLREGGCYAG